MTDDFNEVFYKQVLPNISDYVVEFGKAYKADSMHEVWETITIVKEIPTGKKKIENEDYGIFRNVIKFVYKRNSNGTYDYITVGSERIGSALVKPQILEDLITLLEDRSGVSLLEHINH
jgi:hypothetical protein